MNLVEKAKNHRLIQLKDGEIFEKNEKEKEQVKWNKPSGRFDEAGLNIL